MNGSNRFMIIKLIQFEFELNHSNLNSIRKSRASFLKAYVSQCKISKIRKIHRFERRNQCEILVSNCKTSKVEVRLFLNLSSDSSIDARFRRTPIKSGVCKTRNFRNRWGARSNFAAWKSSDWEDSKADKMISMFNHKHYGSCACNMSTHLLIRSGN